MGTQALGKAEEPSEPRFAEILCSGCRWAGRGSETPLLGSGSPRSVLVTLLTCCGTSRTNSLGFRP